MDFLCLTLCEHTERLKKTLNSLKPWQQDTSFVHAAKHYGKCSATTACMAADSVVLHSQCILALLAAPRTSLHRFSSDRTTARWNPVKPGSDLFPSAMNRRLSRDALVYPPAPSSGQHLYLSNEIKKTCRTDDFPISLCCTLCLLFNS